MDTIELAGEQPLVIINKAELKSWVIDSLDEELPAAKLDKLVDALEDYMLTDVGDWFNDNLNSFLSDRWDELNGD